MDFASLTDDILDYPFLRQDEEEIYTLRQALEVINEDLEHVEWEVEEATDGEKRLNRFVAWTEESVIFLNYTLFSEIKLDVVPRNY